MSTFECIKYGNVGEDGVVEIEMTRMTFTKKMFDEMGAAFRAADADVRVRSVLVWSSSRMFTAGLDLKAAPEMLSGGTGDADEHPIQMNVRLLHAVRSLQDQFSAAVRCRKPVLVAVHGACIGAGVDLVTACDVRFCTDDASFSVAETKVAIVADLGTLQRLPRIVGPGVAREMTFTAAPLPSARALACGLVNATFPTKEEMLAHARAQARLIASHSPLVVQGSKAVLNYAAEHSTADGLEYVALWNTAFLHSGDLMEAMQAFMTRSKPHFKNHL